MPDRPSSGNRTQPTHSQASHVSKVKVGSETGIKAEIESNRLFLSLAQRKSLAYELYATAESLLK